MKTKLLTRTLLAALCTAALSVAPNAGAAIVAPYNPDGATLHLWHLDESAAPALDAVSSGAVNLAGLLNGATLGNAGFSGFGTSLNTASTGGGKNWVLAAGATGGNVTLTLADSTTGAFTFEALVYVAFDPNATITTSMEIISGESTVNGNRIFQWRIQPKGSTLVGSTIAAQPYMTFENVRALSANQTTIYAAIPTAGADAIVMNQWYHVAVTYNGQPSTSDNIKFYWTLVEPTRTAASQLTISSANNQLTGLNPLATITTPFVLGNLARNSFNGNFVGRIDEVRISNIERGPSGMLFSTPEVVIVKQPSVSTIGVGQPLSVSVTAGGAPPFTYQWRLNGAAIAGATNAIYSVLAAQLSDGGPYDVLVSNATSFATSDQAQQTVRTPLNLTWVGSPNWDLSGVNWDITGDGGADVAYSEGDHALFNGQGDPLVFLTPQMHPSSVTVNSASDYTLSTYTGGSLVGTTGLKKAGTGMLVLELLNAYSGPTVVEAGILQVGSDLANGSLGTGDLTNNAVVTVRRSSSLIVKNAYGIGSLTNYSTGSVSFSGTNTLSGALGVFAGTVALSTPASGGAFSNLYVQAPGIVGAHSTLTLGGGTWGPNVPLALVGTTGINGSSESRSLLNVSGSNVINGPLTLGGSGSIQVATTGRLELNGPIGGDDLTGKFTLRGGGTNVLNGLVSLPNAVALSCVDGGQVVLVNHSGNFWKGSEVLGGSTMRFAGNNFFPANGWMTLSGTCDLSGYSQTVTFLTSTNTAPGVTNPVVTGGAIGNSGSGTSIFTLNSAIDTFHTVDFPTNNLQIFAGIIQDGLLGSSGKVAFNFVGGGSLTLTNISTYSGDTTLGAGCTLAFSNNASIANSAHVIVASGASLNAVMRRNGGMSVGAAQVLMASPSGYSAITVVGHLTNNGTIELKLNKSGSSLANDTLQVANSLTYGGTLQLDLSGNALSAGDSVKLFNAASYAGAFRSIVPAVPAFGLGWDTTTLATDGTLRIRAVATTAPTLATAAAPGVGQVAFSWPATHTGWRLQVQTNSITVGLSANWVDVPGTLNTNQVIQAVNGPAATTFYRMIYP